jgi:hypothetical protein
MHAAHWQTGPWELMVHGNLFVQYLHEAAPEHRGSRQSGSINWGMAVLRRPLGQARVGLRTMLSLEPLTIPGCGYPNLLATGETCDGDTIHDRQHPHDLFMELAAEYDRPLAGALRWQLYGGLAGEPALGPVAFPHRPSAASNPVAPIAHHWLDATHVVFGVVTFGIYGNQWKAEGSLFNGREPDEDRAGLDLAPLDSFSGRATWLPSVHLALQLSAGHLEEAEAALGSLPPVDVDRVTASATYLTPFGANHVWSTTLAWGWNRGALQTSHFGLAETSLSFGGRYIWFGRLEAGGKSAHDLHVHEAPVSRVFTVGKGQAGYVRYLRARAGMQPGLGGTVSAALVPASLRPRYGGVGLGFGAFVTLRPKPHTPAAAGTRQ